MSIWTTTKRNMVNRIETLIKRLQDSDEVSYGERLVISDAINEAMIDMCMDYKVDHWRFLQTDATVATVADQGYVDLDSGVFNVVPGTVRIGNDKVLLGTGLNQLFDADPELTVTGKPNTYFLDGSAAADQIRLALWPKPDAVYTMKFKAETIVEAEDISAFPNTLLGALSDKSREISLRNLGFDQNALSFGRSYRDRLMNFKGNSGSNAPRNIQRRQNVRSEQLQSRAN